MTIRRRKNATRMKSRLHAFFTKGVSSYGDRLMRTARASAVALPLMILVLSGLLGCGRHVELDKVRDYQEAQRLNDNALRDFQKPAFVRCRTNPGRLPESGGALSLAARTGLRLRRVYYNLGNTYMQAEQRGLAVAYYRQALRYDPRNPFLRPSLDYAFGDRKPPAEGRTLTDHLLFWKDWVSYPENGFLPSCLEGYLWSSRSRDASDPHG